MIGRGNGQFGGAAHLLVIDKGLMISVLDMAFKQRIYLKVAYRRKNFL